MGNERQTSNANTEDETKVTRQSILHEMASTDGSGSTDQSSWFSSASRRSVIRGAAGVLTASAGALLGLGGSADSVRAQPHTDPCTRPAPDPEPGTEAWYARDRLNAYCATQGTQDFASNPTIEAMHTEVNAARAAEGTDHVGDYRGDPFREPLTRWDGVRGRYQITRFTNHQGEEIGGALYMPLEECSEDNDLDCPDEVPTHSGPPYPGIQLNCHICAIGNNVNGYPWVGMAESLAEEGYMVFTPAVSGLEEAANAMEFFLATPEDRPDGNHNPEWELLDRDHVGITGHSGAASDALGVAHNDDRVSAVVAWDRSRGFEYPDPPTTPTLLMNADYPSNTPAPGASTLPVREREQTPEDDPRFQDPDILREANVDVMQIVPRASTHRDFDRVSPEGCERCSRYGWRMTAYYTLAWFDRYLKGSRDPHVKTDALQRLTNLDRYDNSADRTAIGMGRFAPTDVVQQEDDNYERANQPIELEGLAVRPRLSFYWPSRYYIGEYECEDMRDGDCPQPTRGIRPVDEDRPSRGPGEDEPPGEPPNSGR